jgi:hypothetical protein
MVVDVARLEIRTLEVRVWFLKIVKRMQAIGAKCGAVSLQNKYYFWITTGADI